MLRNDNRNILTSIYNIEFTAMFSQQNNDTIKLFYRNSIVLSCKKWQPWK